MEGPDNRQRIIGHSSDAEAVRRAIARIVDPSGRVTAEPMVQG